MCVQQILKSLCAPSQSDQSLGLSHIETMGPLLPIDD